MPVPFVAPPRPISYGSWGYWMSLPLGRALDRLYADWRFDLVHAHCLAPAGHAAARWVRGRAPAERPAFVVSGHGPDMIHVAETEVGKRACRAALGTADLVMANSTWARRRCEEIAGGPLPVGGRAPGGGRAVLGAGFGRCPCERPDPDRDRLAPGCSQAPRRRVAGDGSDALRAATRIPRDRRRSVPGGAGAPCRRVRRRRSRPVRRPAAESRGGRAGGSVRPVRDAGRGGAVRSGVRGGDGRRAPGDRQSRARAAPRTSPPRAGAWCSCGPTMPARSRPSSHGCRRIGASCRVSGRRLGGPSRRRSRGSAAGRRPWRRTAPRWRPDARERPRRRAGAVARHHPRAAAVRRATRRHAPRRRRLGGGGGDPDRAHECAAAGISGQRRGRGDRGEAGVGDRLPAVPAAGAGVLDDDRGTARGRSGRAVCGLAGFAGAAQPRWFGQPAAPRARAPATRARPRADAP